jgi:hypothetical protein
MSAPLPIEVAPDRGWPAMRVPGIAEAEVHAMLEAQAKKTAAWLAEHPRGTFTTAPAERAVETCLRALQAIPDADRIYADELMNAIARAYLDSAWGPKDQKRRAHALLRIAGEGALS